MDPQYTGNQISQLRKKQSLTQRELAERLHVTDKAVSKWERGVNFPDLGLLEPLAEALGTTPAVLLGLEQADLDETLSALAEISQEQLEEARKDLRIFSWGSIVVALLLALAYALVPRQTAEVYYLLHGMILVIGYTGQGYLFKYGEMKRWEPAELGTFAGAAAALVVYYGYQFITGHYPHWLLVTASLTLAAFFTQVHFLQVMKPKFMRLLPLILSVGAMARDFLQGPPGLEFPSLLAGCAAGCLIWQIRTAPGRKPKQRH